MFKTSSDGQICIEFFVFFWRKKMLVAPKKANTDEEQ